MLLADLGADVVRIERPDADAELPRKFDTIMRGRRRVKPNLKKLEDKATTLDLIEKADIFVEGFRPGVTERLGLGPEPCLAGNPRLIYARITGWGQKGPLAQVPGHDLNYLALTGALHSFGRRDQPPTPPINLMADYAGGAPYLAFGVVSALVEAQRSGLGQVIDAAMIDGVTSLMAKQYGLLAAGLRKPERGVNLLDGGAFFYDVYQCSDGEWLAVGCIEQQFYRDLLRLLDIDPALMPAQDDQHGWDCARGILAKRFRSRSRDEWAVFLEHSEACVTPVLSMAEAPSHPPNLARHFCGCGRGDPSRSGPPLQPHARGTSPAAQRPHDSSPRRARRLAKRGSFFNPFHSRGYANFMKLIEADAKSLLHRHGVPVPHGLLVDGDRADFGTWPDGAAIKAQIFSGGRGLAGLVRLADEAGVAEAARAIQATLASGGNKPLVLIEEKRDIAAEYYICIRIDDVQQRPALMFSKQGGRRGSNVRSNCTTSLRV
jgi:alpha-methylacyl-CoA racemase